MIDVAKLRALHAAVPSNNILTQYDGEVYRALPELLDVYEAACKEVDRPDPIDYVCDELFDAVKAARGGGK